MRSEVEANHLETVMVPLEGNNQHLALDYFMRGLNRELSEEIRRQTTKTLSEAITKAADEEFKVARLKHRAVTVTAKTVAKPRECYDCNKIGHFMKDCRPSKANIDKKKVYQKSDKPDQQCVKRNCT